MPQLAEVWEKDDIHDNLVFRIKQSIFCELRQAVNAQKGQTATGLDRKPTEALPDNWGAQLTLVMQVDETGAVNPGVSFLRDIPGGSFTLSTGLVASSQATRVDRYYSFFSVKSLKPELDQSDTSCGRTMPDGTFKPIDRHGASPLLSDNLGINAWLQGALVQMNGIPSSNFPKSQASKLDVLSYDVKFIVVTTGTVTPSWKLVRLTSATSPALVSANRTRTHELLLTLGPTEAVPATKTSKATVVPSAASSAVHLSGELQQAVANGLRSMVAP
ncbi:hypothetical protein ACVDG8_034180 [Mesorhizobium sp. ORM8.1]